jgi:hypothetical protein
MRFREWLGRIEALLNEDYKTSAERFVRENPATGRETVQRYVDEFKKIVGKKYKQIADPLAGVSVPPQNRTNIDAYPNFHELETVVDYVKGQVDVSGEMKLDSPDVEVAAPPVYEDDKMVVYRANSPRACIAYRGSVPYSWCISRNDSQNMYHAYRFKDHEPEFYFVKNKEKTRRELETWNLAKTVFSGKFRDPWHFFVVQVSKNKRNDPESNSKDFILTSANNDGDLVATWKDVLEKESLLAPLHHLFEPRPLEGDEKEQYDRLVKGVGDEEFARMTYAEKSRYLDIYPNMERPLSDAQWKLLPADLKNKYLGFGVGLSEGQYESLKGDRKAMARYREISERKIKNLASSSKDRDKFKYVKSSELDACSFESFKTFVEAGGMPTEIPSDKEKREYWSAGVVEEARGVMDKWDKTSFGRDHDWWPDWNLEDAPKQKKRIWPNWSSYDEEAIRQAKEGKKARWRAVMANAKSLNLKDATTPAIHRLIGGNLGHEEVGVPEEFDPEDEENWDILDDQKPIPFEDYDEESGEDKTFFPKVSFNASVKKWPETQSFIEDVIRQKGKVPPALATILIFYSPDWRRTVGLLGDSIRSINTAQAAKLIEKSPNRKEISDYIMERRKEFPESEYLDLLLVVNSSDQFKSWNSLGMSEKINKVFSYAITGLASSMNDEVQKMFVRDYDFGRPNFHHGYVRALFQAIRDKEVLAEKIVNDPEAIKLIDNYELIQTLTAVKKQISPKTLKRFAEILSEKMGPNNYYGKKSLEGLTSQ